MINSWKNNLLNLPDPIFFDIMRNYLGDLKTPFNKHDLIRSLSTIMSKKTVKDKIFSLIDNEDSRLLTAIALLESSGIDELYEFTRQYYSFLELHNRVANLQERLLVLIEYPCQGMNNDRKLIKLNPFFTDKLSKGYLDTARIFPDVSVAEQPTEPWLREQLVCAFISFALGNPDIFSAGGNNRRKIEGRFASVFKIPVETDTTNLMDFLGNVCESLGFISKGEHSSVNIKQLYNFGTLPAEDRIILLAAASVSSFVAGHGNNLQTAVKIISQIFKSLTQGAGIHERDFESLLYLARRNALKTNPDALEFTDELITDALCYYGFITKSDEIVIVNPPEQQKADEKLRIQSNFEITAPKGIPIAEEMSAACCSEIRSCDITRSYELTKQAFGKALDTGLCSEEIISRLSGSSAAPLPQNILFSMQSWEKEYSSISLDYGVVMTVSRDRLPLIEHNPGLKIFFKNVPAPGVFVLDPSRENEWRRAFADAGFDILPTSPSPFTAESREHRTVEFGTFSDGIKNWQSDFEEKADEIIDSISLDISKLHVPSDQKQMLEARAKKKLILSKSQLTASNRHEERGEVGGIDYRAKIRLTERALELDNLLEITTARDFELVKRLIKPVKLVKKEASSAGKPPVYKIEGIELPEETEIVIPITKVSYLKMLKSSLFTP